MEFLVSTPLYQKWKDPKLATVFRLLERPPINLPCGSRSCNGLERTFNMVNQWEEDAPRSQAPRVGGGERQASVGDTVVRVIYACAACHRGRHTFLIEFGPLEEVTVSIPLVIDGTVMDAHGREQHTADRLTWIRKVGQHPEWWPRASPELEKALGKHYLYLYKRGLACQGESMGVGASAYYRRMVDDLVNELGTARGDSLEGEARQEFEKAWEDAKRDGSGRIDLVKNCLPEVLREGGANPLSELYGAFSEAIHSMDEEQATAVACEMRQLLLDVFLEIQRSRESMALAARRRPKGGPAA